ncbi:RNA helicase [Crepidotus variabilis]|uniref:RNA helicase n=1 Tax=Crepidotus variabilis TaxID=179855 RepID=A0A9P6JNR4_9AGAR|nr:RNA helicase [Crepidotus variabilis]
MSTSASQNCPNVLNYGSCSDATCEYFHNIFTCEICSFVFPDNDAFQLHLASRQHNNRVSGISAVLRCSICQMNISGLPSWYQHINGNKHLKKAIHQGLSPNVEPIAPESRGTSILCDLCQFIVPHYYWEKHLKGDRHVSREMFSRYKSAAEEAEADKNDVSVEGFFDLDFVPPELAAQGLNSDLKICTTSPHSKCRLVEMRLASNQGSRVRDSGFSISGSGVKPALSSVRPIILRLTFRTPFVGRCEDRIELTFEDTQLRKRFIIARTLKAIVGDKAAYAKLKPSAPYKPRPKGARKQINERDVVEGIRPPAMRVIPYVGKLPEAKIPAPLRTLLEGSESIGKVVKQIKRIYIPQAIESENYGRFFKHLLWIEEAKMEQDLERYDIPDAVLTRYNKYYFLPVPGLAEKRPSVLVGDRMLVQEQGSTDSRWFEGHVHVVRQAEVGLCFHSAFGRYSEGRKFHVRFKLSRIPLRRQHYAMDTVFMEERVLFPLLPHLPHGPVQTKRHISLSLYNPLISKNEPQYQAVVSILTLPSGSAPFVVFGPPGTGKTITIVEAIRQVLAHNPQARVLACAPSNSAADLLASRLKVGLTRDQLFRFYAPSRFKNQVSDDLLPYTYVNADGHFGVPPPGKVRMASFRAIVTTCLSASVAHGIGMARGHFTHIFIDEAGQATEPEAFVSIKTMADSKTNIILSGDPKQLGPIIRSGIARELGLEKSYLERLMERDVYDVREGYGKCVVKLTKNFRSHNSILAFPNVKFYDNDLQPHASPATINYYLKSSYLPNKMFPIVFHAVSGKDDREASSPSFFNIDETLLVKSYVQQLKEDRRFRTTDADIGVITPYHAQGSKIRSTLRSVADGVKVGSVEEFQGQERKVVIISTVRSSKEFVEYDLRHTLGFVANPRRFNVAVTRAQALLIIIGDPQVLSLDPLWRSFLNYVYLNKGWTGPDITWNPHATVNEAGGYDQAVRDAANVDMNEFTRRIETLTMAEVDDEVDGAVDLPWRDLE